MNDPTKFFRVRGARADIAALSSSEVLFGAQIRVNGLELIEEDEEDEDFTKDILIAVGKCTDKGAVFMIQETELEILHLKDL